MPRILLLSSNLMTRVQLESRWRKAGAEVSQDMSAPDVDLIALDLNEPDAQARIGELKRSHPQARLIAYGPHVDGEAFKAAKAAGADECVARGSVIERVLARLESD